VLSRRVLTRALGVDPGLVRMDRVEVINDELLIWLRPRVRHRWRCPHCQQRRPGYDPGRERGWRTATRRPRAAGERGRQAAERLPLGPVEESGVADRGRASAALHRGDASPTPPSVGSQGRTSDSLPTQRRARFIVTDRFRGHDGVVGPVGVATASQRWVRVADELFQLDEVLVSHFALDELLVGHVRNLSRIGSTGAGTRGGNLPRRAASRPQRGRRGCSGGGGRRGGPPGRRHCHLGSRRSAKAVGPSVASGWAQCMRTSAQPKSMASW
jgi:hypothetical protein